jgi:hypothetical protein
MLQRNLLKKFGSRITDMRAIISNIFAFLLEVKL